MNFLTCSGEISRAPISGALRCDGDWGSYSFTPVTEMDVEVFAQIFGLGFTLPLLPCLAAWGMGILLRAVRDA